MIFNCGRFQLDLSKPRVMGIVNVTPDSFSDGGKFNTTEKAIEHASNMDNMFNVGKDLAHYLPQHQVAAAEMASRSIEYLKALNSYRP